MTRCHRHYIGSAAISIRQKCTIRGEQISSIYYHQIFRSQHVDECDERLLQQFVNFHFTKLLSIIQHSWDSIKERRLLKIWTRMTHIISKWPTHSIVMYKPELNTMVKKNYKFTKYFLKINEWKIIFPFYWLPPVIRLKFKFELHE